MDENANGAGAARQLEKATLGGGCFWCVEAVYKRVPGVRTVVSGYAGGATDNPTYEEVCEGRSGHAEVVQVEFDPSQVSYAQILAAFWQAHDPTTKNRQGHDVGTQYRSIILYHDEAQREVATQSRQAAKAELPRPIVTEITALTAFYVAEEYHHDYFARNPNASYCQAVIAPKLSKWEQAHA